MSETHIQQKRHYPKKKSSLQRRHSPGNVSRDRFILLFIVSCRCRRRFAGWLAGRLTALNGRKNALRGIFFQDMTEPYRSAAWRCWPWLLEIRCGFVVCRTTRMSPGTANSQTYFFLLRLSVSISTRPIATGVFLTFVEFCEAAIV